MNSPVPAQNAIARLPFLLKMMRKFNFSHKLGILERLFGKRIAQLGIVRVVLANGIIWKLDLAEPCQRWMVYGDYEGSHLIGWIRHWLRAGGIVVDSGANIGQTLVYYAAQPDVMVFAFEPNETAADWLKECLAYYPQWKVRIERKGLDNANTTRTFQLAGAMSTTRVDWYKGKDYTLTSIKVQRLDDYMEEHGINRIRLWKIDVEGAELNVLQGARNMLRRNCIDALIIEISNQTYTEIRNLLSLYGYHLFTIGNNGHLLEYNEEQIQDTINVIALTGESGREIG